MPDVSAVVKVTITPEMVGKTIGVFVGAECKTGRAHQTQEQILYSIALRKVSGEYFVFSSEEEFLKNIERIKRLA